MDSSETKEGAEAQDRQEEAAPTKGIGSAAGTTNLESNKSKDGSISESKKTKPCPNKARRKASKKKIQGCVMSTTDDSDSLIGSSSTLSESSDSSDDTEPETKQSKGRAKYRAKGKSSEKKRTKKKSINENFSDQDSESSDPIEKEIDSKPAGKTNLKAELIDLQKEFLKVQIQNQKLRLQRLTQVQSDWNLDVNTNLPPTDAVQLATLFCNPSVSEKKVEVKDKKKKPLGSKLEFKRIDKWWNYDDHKLSLTDTNEKDDTSKYNQYLFIIRREHDHKGRYEDTVLEVRSKLLKEVLSKVMAEVRHTSFVVKVPEVSPDLLFLFLGDLRKYYKELKNFRSDGKKIKKKKLKRIELKLKQLKVLIKYLDTDYADVKKTLYPMLESGTINFDLLWALYRPGTIVCSPTHGSREHIRAFKVENAVKVCNMKLGLHYHIWGEYLDYDGKMWGKGNTKVEVLEFKGAQKISSLDCFPLDYHENHVELKNDLITRGKKFVSLQGVCYKNHEGMAYQQRKREVIKVSSRGRVMIDPALHRRFYPGFPASQTLSNYFSNNSSQFEFNFDNSDEEYYDSDDDSCEEASDPPICMGDKGILMERVSRTLQTLSSTEIASAKNLARIPPKTADTNSEGPSSKGKSQIPVFTDEEYLITSPVLLGFSFSLKSWFEFTVSGIEDIVWDDSAYDSLVLEENAKSIVKALVESHKSHSAKNIDDVIRGKGKGLVFVLHGPPGTGKTLTAEGIAELLRYPLYMVSVGELGHDAATLEQKLQMVLDVSYAWGAVLLLDEADVFLEKRNTSDIHRNGLVSIFLRHLEYYQGILFLTTNRVETFDEAFQSRIHVALRYGELSAKARKSVFKMFLERASALENVKVTPLTEENLIDLSKNRLNGRQIKNTVRIAQALAVQNNEALSMSQLQKVLEMCKAFEIDLKSGPGFEDAMRNYM